MDLARKLAEFRDYYNAYRVHLTQNSEARAVIQDIASYEETQETLALLKILALGNREVEEGRVRPVAEVVRRLRARKTAA